MIFDQKSFMFNFRDSMGKELPDFLQRIIQNCRDIRDGRSPFPMRNISEDELYVTEMSP